MIKSLKCFLLSVFLLFPISQVLGQPAVIIDATQQWTDTGIQLNDSSAVMIYAQDYATWNSYGNNTDLSQWFTPAGFGGTYIAVGSSYPCPDCPAFSLIAKIGSGGTPRYIGTYGIIGTEIGGRLYLGINDDITSDNFGRFVALVFP